MKNKILLLLVSLFLVIISYGQVGINTQNPRGLFHIHGGTTASTTNDLIVSTDGNVGIGTLPNSTAKLHIAGNEFVSGIAKFGGIATHTASAQLELGDSNKGFLPNRVALTSSTDKTTVLNPAQGMVVYNTSISPTLGTGLVYYDGRNWIKMVTELPSTALNLRNLQSQCTSKSNSGHETQSGEIINIGEIKIPESGSYAFTFRLYGQVVTKPAAGEMIVYYIALLSNGSLKDTAEMDIIPGTNLSVITYSITLGATLKAGDLVTFRLSHNSGSPYPWTLVSQSRSDRADRTSMIWWKL